MRPRSRSRGDCGPRIITSRSPFLIERFLTAAGLPPFERHWAWFGTASPAEALAFLAPALRARVTPRAPLAHLARIEDELERAGVMRAGEEPPLEAYQMLDFELFLPGDAAHQGGSRTPWRTASNRARRSSRNR